MPFIYCFHNIRSSNISSSKKILSFLMNQPFFPFRSFSQLRIFLIWLSPWPWLRAFFPTCLSYCLDWNSLLFTCSLIACWNKFTYGDYVGYFICISNPVWLIAPMPRHVNHSPNKLLLYRHWSILGAIFLQSILMLFAFPSHHILLVIFSLEPLRQRPLWIIAMSGWAHIRRKFQTFCSRA